MSDHSFTYRNVPVPSPVGPITHDRRQLMAWCEGVDSALKHHAHRLGEFEGEGEPEHVPNDPGKAEWRATAHATDKLAKSRANEIFRLQGLSADLREQVSDRDSEIEDLRQELAEKDACISYLQDTVEDYKQSSEPKENPPGPQPGDRVYGYAFPVGYKTGIFQEVAAETFNNGDSAIRITDSGGEWYLRGSTVRRVYTADSPEPPADVQVLRDSGEPNYFGVRTRSGWDWRLDPITKKTVWGFAWDALAKGARGDLIEFQEGDDD